MELSEAIKSRRSIRHYIKKEIPYALQKEFNNSNTLILTIALGYRERNSSPRPRKPLKSVT